MTNFDLEIAARTVWMEARGEGPEGMLAVAFVIANRLRHRSFGSTLAEVCLAPLQFSCWNTSDPNRRAMALLPDDDPLLIECRTAVANAANQLLPDPTNGATYYCTAAIASGVPWTKEYRQTAKIGHQLFFLP